MEQDEVVDPRSSSQLRPRRPRWMAEVMVMVLAANTPSAQRSNATHQW